MNYFSLKNASIAASLLTLTLGISAFAAPAKTECTVDPLFAANTCDVCYTEAQKPTKTSTGWTTEISSMTIPWDHSGIELQEIITESGQKLPEIITSTDVKATPIEANKIWEFGSEIIWYEVGVDREFFIEK
jgi:hypothetical protein